MTCTTGTDKDKRWLVYTLAYSTADLGQKAGVRFAPLDSLRDYKATCSSTYIPTHLLLFTSVGWLCQNEGNRVQKAINFGARIVSGVKRREHITPVLEALCWLRFDEMVRERDVALVKRLLSSDPPPALASSLSKRSEISNIISLQSRYYYNIITIINNNESDQSPSRTLGRPPFDVWRSLALAGGRVVHAKYRTVRDFAPRRPPAAAALGVHQ